MDTDSQGKKLRKSLILKISLFATGLSGIVAEYILSTLASYFLGDSIMQWTHGEKHKRQHQGPL
ncbi:MAG: hypothetical protein AAFU64_19870, partial [Bacteroidota bacterium]